MGRRKRPGLDGRYAGELAFLPDEILQMLADILDAVEAAGVWPGVGPEGLLLPKAGGDGLDPTQRRPIWLLPMAYRVWAAGRARDVSAWITSWGGGALRGAEELAWELA
eukprot:11181795-Lingulodinium_polyedra.AAC.1